jgi:mono/diheme cytochrome c family protein
MKYLPTPPIRGVQNKLVGAVVIAWIAVPCLSGVARATDAVDFNRDVRPVLSDNCFRCHGTDEKQRQAGLRLDLRDKALLKLESGALAIVPGDPAKSELLRRVSAEDEGERMPPKEMNKRLTPAQVEVLRQWIAAGANYSQHWAFIKPVRPELPTVKNAAWPKNEIDRFILARLEKEGLHPSPEAGRETVIRRLSLDVTGLPPSPPEVDAFLADRSPDAYEKLVDRLLASPRYGERMAVQWLDFARYADSNGFQEDGSRTMWRWRDWLINALNDNMPFDQFTVKQLAGDLLPKPTLEDRIATGFNRNHRTNNEGGAILEEWRVETVIDRVETTSQVWMGLTMGCARCHDHKFDPITQKDFYRFFAFFNNVPETGYGGGSGANTPPLISAPTPEQQARLKELDLTIAASEDELRRIVKTDLADAQVEWEDAALESGITDPARQLAPPKPAQPKGKGKKPRPPAKLAAMVPAKPIKPEPVPPAILAILKTAAEKRTPPQIKQLADYSRPRLGGAIADADKKLLQARQAKAAFEAAVPQSMVMEEMPKPREAFVLIRGQYDNHGEKVTAGLPGFLPPLPAGAAMNRLGLAQWLVSPEHPLTARVWVNRAWEGFFGTGIVKTSENMGSQAEFPSHPELLDWMATEFMRRHWDMKAMVRLIVTSATYRQASIDTPRLLQVDPENRLLARGPRFRLGGEVIRDQALAVSGLLKEKIGGPSVRPYMPQGIWDETSVYGDLRNYKADQGDGLYRRTLYTIWKRTAAPPTNLLFDSPTREICTVKRSRTNTPLQALAVLNEVTFVEAARKLAERMLADGGATPEARLTYGFRLAAARVPRPEELKILSDGLKVDLERFHRNMEAAKKLIADGASNSAPRWKPEELAAYTLAANVLLNLDEVLTRE